MVNLFYAVVFGCILTLGLPFNAVALWILLRRHSLKSPNAVFMVNLAISDLLLVITLPMRVYLYATGTWPLGKMACLFITIVFRNNIRSSALFITFISVDRLLAVVYPLRSRNLRTSSNAVKGAAFVWLYVLLMSIPQSLEYSGHLKEQNSQNGSSCFESVNFQLKAFGIYWQITTISIMLAVNIVCTAMVSWRLYFRLSDSPKAKNKVKVMVIFVMNLIVFALCFLPLSIAGVVAEESAKLTPMICFAAMNCCLDPLLYYFSFDAFWKKKEEVDTMKEQGINNT